MQKINVNNRNITIEDLIDIFTYDDEIDFDSLGAVLDSDTLDKAIDSFTTHYGIYDLIEKYLQLSDKPIEVSLCQT